MLVVTGGRERTMDEHERLLAAAGLRIRRAVSTRTPLVIVEAAQAQG